MADLRGEKNQNIASKMPELSFAVWVFDRYSIWHN